MHIYHALQAAGVNVTEHHESDLYVPYTPETIAIVRASGHSFELFISQIDRQRWIDLPFAYLPFWDAAAARAKQISR
jgi:hypothetical protein